MTTPFPFQSAAVLLASQLNAITTLATSTKTASHTLTISDVSTRVIMNSASATTITVNTSIFGASDVVEILNIGAGVCTVTAGSCTVGTSGSLALAQNAGGTLTFISASASVFVASGVTAAAASGLVCVKAETAFTASATVSADSVFTSTYTNYLVQIIYTSTTTDGVRCKLRAGGTATSTNYNRQEVTFQDTTTGVSRTSSTTSCLIGLDTNGDFKTATSVTFFGPQLAQGTSIHVFQGGAFRGAYTTPGIYLGGHNQSSSTQFDGFQFAPDAGTLTGTYAVYGYSKAV